MSQLPKNHRKRIAYRESYVSVCYVQYSIRGYLYIVNRPAAPDNESYARCEDILRFVGNPCIPVCARFGYSGTILASG